VTNLPGIWQAPTTTPADRKQMVRCLIREVSLDSFSVPGQTRLHIRWQTGCITTVAVRRPTSGDVHRLESTLVAHIRELAQSQPDDRSAEILNAPGFTTQQGLPWTYRRVQDTRRRHQIPTACPITPSDDSPRGDGLVSVRTAAQRLHTSRSTILNWTRKGLLYSEHKAGGCPRWVRLSAEDVARLTRTTAPPQSLTVRQACQRWQLTETHLWTAVRAGQYREGIASVVVNTGSFVLHCPEPEATGCRVVVAPDALEVHYEEPVERALGEVQDKCTRNHTRQRRWHLVQDVEQHLAVNGPWPYVLSDLYYTPEVTAAVQALHATDTTQEEISQLAA
jgi:hypothetical protein